MNYQLLTFLVFALFGVFFVVVTVSVISRLVRPRLAGSAEEPSKSETYECGEPSIGSSWVRFDMRFYTLALVFLIFDVEVTFLFPWALIFRPLRDAGLGGFLLLEVLVFLAILLVGYVYCWARGDLDWIKSVTGQTRRLRRTAAPAARPAPAGPESAGKRETVLES